MAVDTDALLDWVNSLEVLDRRAHRLADLADGEMLLKVMRDLNPEGFQRPGHFLSADGELQALLRGLVEHFRGRPGSGEAVAKKMLDGAGHSGGIDPAQLTQLVIRATLDNELPNRQHYVETCQQLNSSSATAVMEIFEQFNAGDFEFQIEGSQPPSPTAAGAFGRPSEPGFSPADSGPSQTASSSLPDFLEVGLDAETRFRRLKEHYIALKEEQERWDEERASLRWEVEAEQAKRKDAEEAERIARAELRHVEEANDRVKEDQRSIFELRIEQEVASCREELRQRDHEAESLREELELAKMQAQAAQKLQSQLEMFKKKIEECQGWKREKEELRKQLDDITNSRQSGSGTVEHLHGRLASLRDEVAVVSRERDEAQLQLRMVQAELEKCKSSARRSGEDLRQLHGDRGTAPYEVVDGTAPPETLAGAAAAAQSSEAVRESAGEAMLERLLAEKERATRAETTLQLKQAEVATLTEQRTKDSAQITSLEAEVQRLQSKATEPAGAGSAEPVDSAKVRELQAQLSLRERELQVHHWRGRAESSSLLAQEALMASCFHELGLRYQQLRVQHELLQQKLQRKGGCAGVAAAKESQSRTREKP